MEFYYYSPSETFVVLTADQFLGRDDGLLEQQRQDSRVCQRNRTLICISSQRSKTRKVEVRRIYSYAN